VKASLKIEYIGESQDAKASLYFGIMREAVGSGIANAVGKPPSRRPWVARIVAADPRFGYTREFIKGKMQRVRANGPHSRGVELWFVLETGYIYEVKAFVSWKSVDRYFCRVNPDGDIERLGKEEVDEWLRKKASE